MSASQQKIQWGGKKKVKDYAFNSEFGTYYPISSPLGVRSLTTMNLSPKTLSTGEIHDANGHMVLESLVDDMKVHSDKSMDDYMKDMGPLMPEHIDRSGTEVELGPGRKAAGIRGEAYGEKGGLKSEKDNPLIRKMMLKEYLDDILSSRTYNNKDNFSHLDQDGEMTNPSSEMLGSVGQMKEHLDGVFSP